ncbi:MAG: hypothetical protein HC765_06040 [Brachymonas sp.]|nr:hypothetical protein [Brachymonas sp.]
MAMRKTELGVQVMKDRSLSLTPQQRSALILVDGKRSQAEVLKVTAAVGVTAKDLEVLAEMGLIEMDAVASEPAADVAKVTTAQTISTAAPAAQTAEAVSGVDFTVALNAAITFCADLGFKGFSLNMALTGVDSLEKLQKLAPEIRKAAGDKKYAQLHGYIFGKPMS